MYGTYQVDVGRHTKWEVSYGYRKKRVKLHGTDHPLKFERSREAMPGDLVLRDAGRLLMVACAVGIPLCALVAALAWTSASGGQCSLRLPAVSGQLAVEDVAECALRVQCAMMLQGLGITF